MHKIVSILALAGENVTEKEIHFQEISPCIFIVCPFNVVPHNSLVFFFIIFFIIILLFFYLCIYFIYLFIKIICWGISALEG